MLFLILALSISRILGQECYDDGNEFCIDREDILSIDLLPGSFLLMNQYKNEENLSRSSNSEDADGSYDNALTAMDYHRKRMNEYLCHGFMAEEIFKEVGSARVKRRPESSPVNTLNDFLGEDNVTVHDKLLSDEGSTKYKDWLQRTTTLDDIYRHYAPNKRIRKKQGFEGMETIEEFDGEVTGFAMQAPVSSGKVGMYGPPTGEDHMIPAATGHNYHYGPYDHGGDHYPPAEFYPAIHEEQHIYHPAPHYHEEEEHHKPIYIYSKGKGHELSIKDFFEIALTALAFLSFGLFIIQLLMNATNGNGATAVVTDAGGRTRFKRNVKGLLSYPGNEELNELSYHVLRSIEASLVIEADSGNCLRRILCEDNQYAKATNDGRRIWIPMWSLGMSWVSGRTSNASPWSVMLDSVKASVLGLGGANCESLYPNCNLWKERVKRRRRRRK